jgi:hypothetical protein
MTDFGQLSKILTLFCDFYCNRRFFKEIAWQECFVAINLWQRKQKLKNHEKSIDFNFVPGYGTDVLGSNARVDP